MQGNGANKTEFRLVPDMWLRQMQNNTSEKIIGFMLIGGRNKLGLGKHWKDLHVKPGRKLNGKVKEDIGQDHWEIYLKTILIGVSLSKLEI